MASIKETLQSCFHNSYHRARGYLNSNYVNVAGSEFSLMTIPIREEDTFEVPLDALDTMYNIQYRIDKVKSIVMSLSYSNKYTGFKTLDANLKATLGMKQDDAKLTKLIQIQDKGWYYNSFGTIYDKDFYPIMMCSWLMKLVPQEDEETPAIKLIKPILRVDPQVFINKSNAVERYIINKIIPAALELNMANMCYRLPFIIDDIGMEYKVKVEIDECPFIITKPVVPTIRTTNESLIKAALDNVDDMTL